MTEQNPPQNAAGVGSPNTRPKFHLIYYLLAAFDLLTVMLGLFLIDRVTSIYTDSVDVNQVWAHRLSNYSELRLLAAAVNAPGNDVFNTRDVATESARLAEALQRFNERAKAVREDLARNVDDGQAAALLRAFDAISPTIDAMVAEADRIFVHFRNNEAEKAGERMAEMDRDYAAVGASFAKLGRQVRAIQKSHFDEQTALAASLRKFELLIAGLIVLMVTGVTIYGRNLAKRMKQAARQTAEHLRALAESEARNRAVLVSALDPVITIDACGDVQTVSDSIERVFGWKPREVIGRNIKVFIPGLYHSAHETSLAPCRETDVSSILGQTREFEAVRKDGTTFPIELSLSRVEAPGRDLALFTGIVRDVSQRRQTEEELARYREHLETLVEERTRELQVSHEQLRLAERLASIGTLAAGLGHDMNNILFPIRCRLDALDAAKLPPPAQEQFEALRKSVNYLQQLSDGLHLLALDPDDPRAASGVTPLRPWWDEVYPLLLSALPKHATLKDDLPDDLPVLAVASHRLTQAVFNLVVNAGEAICERGTVKVWAEALDDRRFVRIAVTDDGHGMPPEVRRQALDPFFTTKTRGLSTGLGLALVHGVCKSAEGSIEIDSAPGRGTTIALILPAYESTERPRDVTTAGMRTATVSIPDPRIATLVATLLKSFGLDVRKSECDDPGDANLWVTTASNSSVQAATRFLDGPDSRRVIVFGNALDEWTKCGAIVIEEAAGLDAIQKAIRAAVSSPEEALE